MYQPERMQSILEFIKNNKRISVEDICSIYNVSRDTARRDLVNLEKKGVIVRTHGGAILPISHEEIQSYTARLDSSLEEKKAIGSVAASLIKDGNNIIMDTSTTVQAAAELLQVNDCTVVTNSINLADILSKKPGVHIHLLGGQFDGEQRFLYGSSTINMLSDYFVDKAFIGALGITEKGLTVAHKEDAFVMRKMIEQSRQVIVLADHSKFGKNGFFKVADLDKLDVIITDKGPEKEFMKVLQDNRVNIVIAKNEG
jgi:DeoR/GlpR family transcriptional regulator of sugar metabolism